MIKQVALKVKGRVQGVFYRSEAQLKAFELGLKGYAKNNSDGTVTVVAVGEEEDLKKLEAWCRRGPDSAQVESVEATYEEPQPDKKFTEFELY